MVGRSQGLLLLRQVLGVRWLSQEGGGAGKGDIVCQGVGVVQ